MLLLEYQNSSAEFPEAYISMNACWAVRGTTTVAFPPLSSAMVKKFDWFGDRFVMGRTRFGTVGLGKWVVGA